MTTISRKDYALMFGPTTGDKVRLGDTNLIAEVEYDYAIYGEEIKFGGGKSIRDGMAQKSGVGGYDENLGARELIESDSIKTANAHNRAKNAKNTKATQEFRGIFENAQNTHNELDLVITNALIIDYTGIFKADVGIKNGLIYGIGKAGNPHTQNGVSANLIVGASTEVIAGEGLILTAGGIDTHIHFIAPQQIHTALFSGITTMIGGGSGPAAGTNATTCTPGEFNLSMMLKAAQHYPMNLGFFGKGNSSNPAALEAQIKAGALGLKIHEDWGSTPSVINTALSVADNYDVQVAIHTDTLNESGFVEDTIEAINHRTIHTFHTEGAGGGHAPDIIKMAGLANVLPASTNPTLPFTTNTLDEHLDMLMVCHHLDKRIKEDVAFADSRIRPESIAAEDVLHDRGIISITSSDSQAMGRVGEVITRSWQLAHKNKAEFGALKEERGKNDNVRIKRYIAKYTINPAIASGISDFVGSIEVGKIADLVLWNPAFFGVKPEMIIKGGFIIGAKMGDINASIPTPEPVIYRESFGAHGGAKSLTSVLFTSRAAIDLGIGQNLGLDKKLLAVRNCRNIGKKDLPFNDVITDIRVNPQTYEVFINNEKIISSFARKLPLAQLYHLF